MIEEILQKVSSANDKTSKNEKELPKTLPSSHSKYVIQRTTFGRVRIDLPSKSEQRKMIESLYKNYDPTSEQNRIFDARIWSLVDEDINNNEHGIDFYGLINAHYRNSCFEDKLSSSNEKLSDNYIDQLAFPELTIKKSETESINLRKQTIEELKNEEMNLIDEQYFGTLKQIEYQDKQIDKNISTKKTEMPPTDELNYIDQLAFTSSEKITKKQNTISNQQTEKNDSKLVDKSTKNSLDDFLDINFQFRISTPTPKLSTKLAPNLNGPAMDSYNPKLESMRSIKPKDYFDPPRQSSLDMQNEKEIDSDKTATKSAEHIREQLTKNTNTRDRLGYRIFEHLVPKWYTMTKAEILDVLVKQICFIRRNEIKCVPFKRNMFVYCINLDGILALDKPYGLSTIDK